MMCSDTAELPTAGCVGFWTGKDGQIQSGQRHHKIQKPYIGEGCENLHTLGLICSWDLLHVSAIAHCQAQVTWRLSLYPRLTHNFYNCPFAAMLGPGGHRIIKVGEDIKDCKVTQHLSCCPLNHIPTCHLHMPFEHSQG